jgi:hypothetical protein
MKYTNKHNIAVPMAVFLAHDDYDHSEEPNTISATSLLKSTRETILTSRIKPEDSSVEISTLIASRIGSAIHAAVESAWLADPWGSLLLLGYPERIVEKVTINPVSVQEGDFPVYLEQRATKKVGKWTVSGKFDMIFNGEVHDIKSTGVYTFIKKTNDAAYTNQLSIYKWLNPEKAHGVVGKIQFVFKDWVKHYALSKANYPAFPIMEYTVPINDPDDTEIWVRQKLTDLDNCWDKPEPELPLCTREELWQNPPKFAYYSKQGATKASKVLDSMWEANQYQATKGKGFVQERPDSPTKCLYCPAIGICGQAASFIASGALVIE